MSNTLVSQRDEFECAYIMSIGDSPPILHAHHYRVEVAVSGNQRLIDHGIVIEFDKFKHYLRSVLPNNAFLYDSTSEYNDAGRTIATELLNLGIQTVACPFIPSAENLAGYIARELQSILNRAAPGVTVVEVKLRETANSFATWSIR